MRYAACAICNIRGQSSASSISVAVLLIAGMANGEVINAGDILFASHGHICFSASRTLPSELLTLVSTFDGFM